MQRVRSCVMADHVEPPSGRLWAVLELIPWLFQLRDWVGLLHMDKEVLQFLEPAGAVWAWDLPQAVEGLLRVIPLLSLFRHTANRTSTVIATAPHTWLED
jgi:hypothetical protein